MTSLTLAPQRAFPTLRTIRDVSPLLWWTSLAFLALFVLCSALATLDPRLFNGISVWIKPAKFSFSLAVHMLTLSLGLLLLPERQRNAAATSAITVTMASMAIFEMAYIGFRAARGEASHFNTSSAMAELLYSLMGMGAALMMVVTAYLGLRILRHAPATLLGRTTGWSFILAAMLTLVAGFTLGGMGSHWIGGDQTDATGLPVVGWSTTGGDLRAAHFLGLHLMQALPVLALLGSGALVWIAASGGVAITVVAYVMALNGIPMLALTSG